MNDFFRSKTFKIIAVLLAAVLAFFLRAVYTGGLMPALSHIGAGHYLRHAGHYRKRPGGHCGAGKRALLPCADADGSRSQYRCAGQHHAGYRHPDRGCGHERG